MRKISILFVVFILAAFNIYASFDLNFTNQFYFINKNVSGNDNSIYNEPVKNHTDKNNLTMVYIHSSITNKFQLFNIDGKLNFNYTDAETYFTTSYLKIYNNFNAFTIGYLPLEISPIIINRNDIFGIKWDFNFSDTDIFGPLPFQDKTTPIQISVCGGKLNDGVYYPRYLLGGDVKINIDTSQFAYHYYNVFDQKSEHPIGEITDDEFSLSDNNVVKIFTSKQQGVVRKNINVNLDDYPDLTIRIINAGDEKLSWSLDVNDGTEQINIQPATSDTGELTYDLKALTKWSGSKTILITITIYNYLYDLKDNGLYVDWIKIYNSDNNQVFWVDEYFDDWMKADDTDVMLVNKDDLFKYLPEDLFDKKYSLHSFSWRKSYGKFTGRADISFNNSQISPTEVVNGFAINSFFNYKFSKKINLSTENIVVDKNFKIKPLIGYPTITKNIKDDDYFYFGYTDLMGNWSVDRTTIVPADVGIKITGKGGDIYKEVEVNLDLYPYLSINIDGDINKNFEWALYLIDDTNNEILIQQPISQKGVFSYNIADITGWHGVKKFKIKITKGENNVKILWLKFWHSPVVKNYILSRDERYSDLNFKYNNKKNIGLYCKLSSWGSKYKNYSIKLFAEYLWLLNKKININVNGLFEYRKGKEIRDIWSYPIYSESAINNNKPGIKFYYFYKKDKLIEGEVSYLFNTGNTKYNSMLFNNIKVNFPLRFVKLIYSLKNMQGEFLNEKHFRTKHSIVLKKRINIAFDTYCDINYNFNLFFNKIDRFMDYQQNNITINIMQENFLGIEHSEISLEQKLNYVSYLNQQSKYNTYILKLGSKILY